MDQPNKRLSDSVSTIRYCPSIESSELHDAGRKWCSYRRIPNRKHYLVLSKERVAQVHSASSTQARSR
jgi:hypothetical protein